MVRDELYTGSTSNLRSRISDHNSGKEFSTRRYKPWRLLYYEAYETEQLARTREHRLKHHGNALREVKKRIGLIVQPKHKKNGAAFTLIELLIVMAIMSVIAAFAIPSYLGIRRSEGLDTSAQRFVDALRTAQNHAQTGQCAKANPTVCTNALHVFPNNDTHYTIYTGTWNATCTPANSCYDSLALQLDGGVKIINGGNSDIVFARLKGAPSSNQTIVIGFPGGAQKTILVTTSGAITLN